MKKHQRNTQKGITLIALIITIIVLLILAVVSIRLVMNDGILGKAESATTQYGTAEEQEQIKIGYADYQMAQASGEANPTLTVAGADVDGTGPWAVEFSKTGNIYTVSSDGKTISLDTAKMELKKEWESAETITSDKTNIILNATENTKLKDEYGNKIVVPAGFKIKKDADTNNATHVTEGIVVTDGTNEFVWIPVGKIYTDVAKTESKSKTITLGRYSSFTVGATPVQTLANYSEKVEITGLMGGCFHTEDASSNYDSDTYKNVIANDIKAFLESSNNNGGYYLGRYEARTATERTARGDELTTLTENKNDYVYNFVTQSQASKLSQEMYTNQPFTSDLINSYAWDTAIIFIENFGGNATYARESSVNTSYANKGTSRDKISNIYDMASNCYEWSTEAYDRSGYPCTDRGGSYSYRYYYPSSRGGLSAARSDENHSFRPLLYV